METDPCVSVHIQGTGGCAQVAKETPLGLQGNSSDKTQGVLSRIRDGDGGGNPRGSENPTSGGGGEDPGVSGRNMETAAGTLEAAARTLEVAARTLEAAAVRTLEAAGTLETALDSINPEVVTERGLDPASRPPLVEHGNEV